MKNNHQVISIIEKAIPLLCCPACRNGSVQLNTNSDALSVQCPGCGSVYPVRNGIVDFFPEYSPGKSLSQAAMENKYIVSFYEKYFRPAFTRFGSPVTYKEEEAWLDSHCSDMPVASVLDVASGTGKYARHLADLYDPDMVIALDLSMPMLEHGLELSLSRGYNNILFIKGDAQCLPVKSKNIGHVNCFGALHLFPDAFTAMKEFSRVGTDRAVFTCLTACKLDGAFTSAFQRFFSKVASFAFFNIDDLKDQLKELNFTDFNYLQRKMLLMFCARLAG